MFAALPMYDHPCVREETDALWASIRAQLQKRGLETPMHLSRKADIHTQWESPNLLLGQTCGLPYRTELHHRVTLLGAMDYDLPNTPQGYYYSVFVARTDDPRERLDAFDGARLAFSDSRSHSGWAVACAAPVRFSLGPQTGSHRESIQAVTDGQAEIAAIDAITYFLLTTRTELTRPLKVVGHSAATPGMALITAMPQHKDLLRDSLQEGIAALSQRVKSALGLRSFVHARPRDYLAVCNPPSPEAYAAAVA